MTTKEILARGVLFRKDNLKTDDDAKRMWLTEETRRRFSYIPWTLEARAIGLRQAARRFRARGKGRV